MKRCVGGGGGSEKCFSFIHYLFLYFFIGGMAGFVVAIQRLFAVSHHSVSILLVIYTLMVLATIFI